MVNILGKRGWMIWLLMLVSYSLLEAYKPNDEEPIDRDEEYDEDSEDEREKERSPFLMPLAAGAALATGVMHAMKSTEEADAKVEHAIGTPPEREAALPDSVSAKSETTHVRIGTSMPGWEKKKGTRITIESTDTLAYKLIERERQESKKPIEEALEIIDEIKKSQTSRSIKSPGFYKTKKEQSLRKKIIEKGKMGTPNRVEYWDSKTKKVVYEVEEYFKGKMLTQRTIYPQQSSRIEKIITFPKEMMIWLRKDSKKLIQTRAITLIEREEEMRISHLIINEKDRLFDCTYHEGKLDKCTRVRYATVEALKEGVAKLDQKRVREIHQQIIEDLKEPFITTDERSDDSKKQRKKRYSYSLRVIEDPREGKEGKVIIIYLDHPHKKEKELKDPAEITQIRIKGEQLIGVVTQSKKDQKEYFYIYEKGKPTPQDMKILPRLRRRRKEIKSKAIVD